MSTPDQERPIAAPEAGTLPDGPLSAEPPVAHEITDAAWLDMLDSHAAEHGFHARLGARHGALYTEDDDSVLLVTFEDANHMRRTSPALPYGLKAAGKEGWSQLAIYSEGDTWFRDPEVYAFFDDLVDDGFFDLFDTVLFYGVGAGGYAACAFSVAAPFSRVLALRPHATLSPERAIWDRRYPGARRLSFHDRYGDAPALLEAAERAVILYDPQVPEDAMHATLYGAQPMHLRTPMLGARPEEILDGMGVIDGALRLLAKDRMTRRSFAHLYRRRRRSPAYLRHVLTRLERADRPFLQALWCRAGLRDADRPRLRQGLDAALSALRADGRDLPPPRFPAASSQSAAE